MEKILLFDFFGVICSEVAPFWLLRHYDEAQAKEIKATVVHAADLGRITATELFEELGRPLGLSGKQVSSEWAALSEIDQKVVRYIRERRSKGFRTGLITNAPSHFVRGLLSSSDLEPLFETIVVSSELGCAKPDERIYLHTCHELGIAPREAVMIDDNEANVAAAQVLGMDGVVYRTFSDLPTP